MQDDINISDPFLKLRQFEQQRIREETKIERQWWGDKRFATIEERVKAIKSAQLLPIEYPCEYFGLPAYLRGSENYEKRHLNKEGLALLYSILKELNKRTSFTKKGIRLIITSLHRTDTHQESVRQSAHWYRAVNPGESSHASGAAFDINIRTYYIFNKETRKLIGTWVEGYEDLYDPTILIELIEILKEKKDSRDCNYVIENTIDANGSHPSVIHICASPSIS